MNALAFAVLAGTVPAFALSAALGRPLIERLRRASFRQTAYELAPATHQKKSGTPTMGGVLFAVAPLVALAFDHSWKTMSIVVLMLGCAAIGAVDDVAAIRKEKNRGLRARPKFALTAVAGAIFLVLAAQTTVPQVIGIGIVPVWVWAALSLAVVLSTTHAVNLTDGLDGLAGGTILPPLVVLGLVAALHNGDGATATFVFAVAGSVLGFLVYNRYPAWVFMGDTGSLALGGALAGAAVLSGAQLLLILIGGVFVAETLSVIIQVASFKTTGRRVFRISPLHHHFELGGWPETKVTARFWLASLVLSIAGFAIVTRT